jgi:translation initiation factor 4A
MRASLPSPSAHALLRSTPCCTHRADAPSLPTDQCMNQQPLAKDGDVSDGAGECAIDATLSCTGDTPHEAKEDDADLSVPVDDFDKMGLKDDLLRGIYGYGFESPSQIQQRAILPLAFSDCDVIAQAQSGTGKTGAFSIGLLQTIDPSRKECQAIVLSPTRELTKQSASVASALGRFLGVSVLACVGGASMREQADGLRRGAHLVLGTPGRVLDLIQRRLLDPRGVRILLLDEADEMLTAGFRDDMVDVIQSLPKQVRLALFSATLPPETLELASTWMPDNPVKIIVKKEELTLAGIRSFYVYCGDDERDKLPTLCDLYEGLSITQAVIFVNHRRKAEWLCEALNERDFTVFAIHSDLTQEERSATLDRFRKGEARVLIATDVLARGIDVQQVNLVLNFDLPRDTANYIHRVGRSGRFGRKGSAINLLCGSNGDVRSLRDIEQYYATAIDELPHDLSVVA